MPVLVIKSGTTAIAGATVKGSFTYFSGSTLDFGPTSSTGFYSGVDAPNNGYTVYQIGGTTGWTARVATDTTNLNSILIGAGATGSTLDQRITWATNTNSVFINSGATGVITSNVYLWYDFGNTSCYPGTGTSITSLAGSVPAGTVAGSPSFTSGSNGFFTFTGSTSQFINTNNSSPSGFATSGFTVQIIASTSNTSLRSALVDESAPINPPGWGTEFGTLGGSFNTNGTRFWASDNIRGFDCISNNTITTNNKIYMITFVWNASTKTAETYVNQTLAATATNTLIGNFDNARSMRIASGYDAAVASFSRIYYNLVYNTPLTSSQVTQNFNALQSRFGL